MKLEIWKSDNNKEERHYFLDGESNTYVLGYNPDIFSEEEIEALLTFKKIKL